MFLTLVACLSWLSLAGAVKLVKHDSSFAPDYVLRISATNLPISCTHRYSHVVNGTDPGPTLRIPEGKTTWVRVYNDLATQNTTIHWHGLSEMVAPFSDGTPQAAQWPIPPGHWFDYELHPSLGSAGTYFYHSHVEFQANSAAGALIIEDSCDPPYDYDDERVIVLTDYFNSTDTKMEQDITSNPFVWIGETNNVLMNGQGYLGSQQTSSSCQLHQLKVDPGKIYRLRFIAATGLSFVSMAFENHDTLTTIEADGAYTQALNLTHLQIGSGQRFSVLLKTKTTDQLAADGKKEGDPAYVIQMKTLGRPTVFLAYGALQYNGYTKPLLKTPSSPPALAPNITDGWLDYKLAPLKTDPKFPSAVEVTRSIKLLAYQYTDVNGSGPGSYYTMTNSTPWTASFPQMPYLVALYENDISFLPNYTTAVLDNGYDRKVRAFAAEIGEVLDIVIETLGQGNSTSPVDLHPFHFHGAHYWDLGSGNGTYNKTMHENRLEQAYKTGWQPPKRDTTFVYQPDVGVPEPDKEPVTWRAWRIRITDPGVWMLHCHTLAHIQMGMQSVWVMGNISEVAPLPPSFAKGYLTYGGNAYGKKGVDPFVVHYFDD